MLPASNRGVGMNIGFPDVCLTPTPAGPVPIPYPNIAMHAQAVGFSLIVKVSGVHALNLGSKIPITMGDEPGTAHPVFKQVGTFVMGNPVVFVDRLPAICLTCPTMGNAGNNAVGAVLVPSAVNVLYTYAIGDAPATSGLAPRALSSEDVHALGEAMLGAHAASSAPLISAMLDDQVGYLRVRLITTDMPSRFCADARALEEQGATALVLDLRGCPGGDLDAAVQWAGDFLDAGAEIVRVEDDEGDELIRRATFPAAYRMPLVVVVDRATASAAEVVVACLKAHGRAVILGEATYGKGTLQRLYPGDDGGFIYATAARCRTVGGAAIDGAPVLPDVELEGASRSLAADPREDTWIQAAQAATRARP
jgi:carboxyl-terminal processing protease